MSRKLISVAMAFTLTVVFLVGAGHPLDAKMTVLGQEGTPVWFEKTYGGATPDPGWSLVQTTDGGYAIAGGTSGAGGKSDVYLIKIDAVGP